MLYRITLLSLLILVATHPGSAKKLKYGYFLKNFITRHTVDKLPAPIKSGNYYILQSIDNATNVIIGDLSSGDGFIYLLCDVNSNGKLDYIYRYNSRTKNGSMVSNPPSGPYKSYKDLKNKIIDGTVFKSPGTLDMKSLPTLKAAIGTGMHIARWYGGYNVKVYDPDVSSSVIYEFFFSKNDKRYNLIFLTYYYKVRTEKHVPPITVSVACKDSKDPVVAKVVDELIKEVKKRPVFK